MFCKWFLYRNSGVWKLVEFELTVKRMDKKLSLSSFFSQRDSTIQLYECNDTQTLHSWQ